MRADPRDPATAERRFRLALAALLRRHRAVLSGSVQGGVTAILANADHPGPDPDDVDLHVALTGNTEGVYPGLVEDLTPLPVTYSLPMVNYPIPSRPEGYDAAVARVLEGKLPAIDRVLATFERVGVEPLADDTTIARIQAVMDGDRPWPTNLPPVFTDSASVGDFDD